MSNVLSSPDSAADREEEFALTETTPTSPSPGSFSPAGSVHSVGVSSASSPTAAARSPEYTGVAATTGETGLAETHRNQVSLHVVCLYNTFVSVSTRVYQALFSHIPGPLHTQWQQQAAPLQRPDSSCPVWGAALQSLLRPPPTACQSTPTERSMGIDCFLFNSYSSHCINVFFKLILALNSSYTGSYNYGSYANQHPHSIQSQYPSLTHEPAIPAPLHYSAYHRSSAQVSLSPNRNKIYTCSLIQTTDEVWMCTLIEGKMNGRCWAPLKWEVKQIYILQCKFIQVDHNFFLDLICNVVSVTRDDL